MPSPLYAGVDVGASASKVALIDAQGALAGKATAPSGLDFVKASEDAYRLALADAGALPADVAFVVASGYGRRSVAFAKATKTEIACHARGAYHHFAQALTVVDIGGQDNKIIRIGADGARLDFKMNRKCAAGTGSFLEEIARRVGISMEELEGLARQSTLHVEIGSFCTVFAATEILALIRRDAKVPDIVKGAFRSVVKRVTEMATLSGKIVATGGVVAFNPTIVELLSEAIGTAVVTPPLPQLEGAIGAALYARDEARACAT